MAGPRESIPPMELEVWPIPIWESRITNAKTGKLLGKGSGKTECEAVRDAFYQLHLFVGLTPASEVTRLLNSQD